VLNGLDLEVGKGRSLVVIGGSGTGKSVMLKCILGILSPDAGEIKVGGDNVVGLRGEARDQYLARSWG
jgi:phospholipid/cholesterol/gamma-HCH transport system ATP-binding protein